MKKRKNAGFSLIELIIVVAIMAILVGVMAPLLLRYIEKTHVASDIQLADTIRNAVALAIVDVEVQNDAASQPFLQQMETSTGMNLDNDATFLSTDCVLRDSLEATFGFSATDLMSQLRSSRGSDCHCTVTTTNGIVKVVFTCTDREGTKDTSNSTPGNDIVAE